VTYDLGPVGNRLPPGDHVLSVIGLNRPGGSTDFVLVADLTLGGSSSGGVINNGTYILTTSNSLVLTGSNTMAGSTRVTVNGDDAAYNSGNGAWSRAQPLSPGFNRLYIAAHDATGAILTNITQDVVYQAGFVSAGGTVSTNLSWNDPAQVVFITNNLVVTNGARLTVGPGVVVLVSAGASLIASTNSSIASAGVDGTPAYFMPATTAAFGALTANGSGSDLTLQYAEVVGGQVRVLNGGTLLMEDSVVRDLPDNSREVIDVVNGAGVTMRRVYMTRFAEGDSQNTPFLMEDSLLEGFLVDGMDLKATNSPLVVRRTTLRNADPNNSNADGIDFGPGPGTVENCLIYNFPDKGVSIGGASGTVIRDSLILNCGIGISAYSSSNCLFFNTTIAGCSNGMLLRDNPGPAFAAATNLIVWGNLNNVVVTNTSTLAIGYSDVQGTLLPGEGNLSSDPLFRNPSDLDYRLQPGSPASSSGLDGVDMGARFPVGGIPSAPERLTALSVNTNGIVLQWQDTADNEDSLLIQRSTDSASWQLVGTVGAGDTNFQDNTAAAGQAYYYRVRALNASGVSAFSNPARGQWSSNTLVGGVLTQNTTWSGEILVGANVIVPGNITLTILSGAVVKLTNNASIIAQTGGVIRVEGTADREVVLQRWNGTNNWGELRAEGTNSSLIVRYADISGGQTTLYFGAVGLLEDSYFHDFYQRGPTTIFNQPLVLTHFAGPTIMRRCLLNDYHETLWRHGLNVIEDCVFEDTVGDALDFDAALPGSTIRRCTFRHGVRGNVDAVDIGNDGPATSSGVIIESCMMYDFPFDKGISIGEGSTNTVVTNCFMYNCNWGVGVKDSSTAALFNNTIINCDVGFRLYNKIAGTGSGIVTDSFNNILWENTNGSIAVLDGGSITVSYSDLFETNWPGTGNLSADPLFRNPAARDYRLTANSPARGSGRNGTDMGAKFPVGSIMAPSHPSLQRVDRTNGVALISFWADSERTYTLESADDIDATSWTRVADVATASRPRYLTVTNSSAADKRFYRLITPARP
jgi:hypothetical protein